MNKIDKIKQRREELVMKPTSESLTRRKERLLALIKKHGYECVSAASGISVASIITYTRTKEPNISNDNLTIAENILADFE